MNTEEQPFRSSPAMNDPRTTAIIRFRTQSQITSVNPGAPGFQAGHRRNRRLLRYDGNQGNCRSDRDSNVHEWRRGNAGMS